MFENDSEIAAGVCYTSFFFLLSFPENDRRTVPGNCLQVLKIAGAQKGKKCVNKFVPGSVQSNNFSFSCSCSHLCSQVCNAKGPLVTQRVNWDQAADYWVNN